MTTDKSWDDIPSLNLEIDSTYSKRLEDAEGRRHTRTDGDALRRMLDGRDTLPIRIATAQKGVFDGMVLDLSKSGVRLTAPKKLDKGELVKVGFMLNDRTIISKAITRWVSPKPNGCSAGLEFHDLPKDLAEYIASLSSANLLNKVGKVKEGSRNDRS
ncbi:MAG: PilZ domain-containing protein [Proteobacteria bacterium]|nr:PilZ domain-containing protein [Pseudomonadota bacterium]MBU1688966.1 PilZ domain-containing protein [Pseudomonadota bacterium]